VNVGAQSHIKRARARGREAHETREKLLFTYLVDTALPKSAARTGRWRLLCHRRRHRRSDGALSLTFALVVAVGRGRRCEVAHRR